MTQNSIDKIVEKHCIYANGKEEIEIVEQTEQLIKDFYLLKSKIQKYVGQDLKDTFYIKDYVFRRLIKDFNTEDKMQLKPDSLIELRRLKRDLNK